MTLAVAEARLRTRREMPFFAVSPWDPELDSALRTCDADELFAGVTRGEAAACALAGLHLWNDSFDAAHGICQAVSTATGSYWHQLCHRREGNRGSGLAANLSNTRYWIRASGDHPAYPLVYEAALRETASAAQSEPWAAEANAVLRAAGAWDPGLVVDWAAASAAGTLADSAARILSAIQLREIEALYGWCRERSAS